MVLPIFLHIFKFTISETFSYDEKKCFCTRAFLNPCFKNHSFERQGVERENELEGVFQMLVFSLMDGTRASSTQQAGIQSWSPVWVAEL